MASTIKKVKKPSWVDVKAKLANFDNAGLIQFVADLYAAEKVNQAFLHARFSIGGNPLEMYKKRIQKALFPNVMGRNSDVKITDAVRQSRYRFTSESDARGDHTSSFQSNIITAIKSDFQEIQYAY